MKLLLVDNRDSFTYMLADYLRQTGAECSVVRNQVPPVLLDRERFDAVVLSPGPGVPRQAGYLMDIIAHYHQKLPMLGVCLGHQAFAEFFGARLTTATRPMHGKLSAIQVLTGDPLFQDLPRQFAVTRYHSLVVKDLPEQLLTLAISPDEEVMAFRHVSLPLWGIQFHPEAVLTEFGFELLANWINLLKIRTFEIGSGLKETTL
ncbi:aminodeoxychorismate/anthranilate synthase component II [Nibrella saemangeumensis]|uniref:Aminodeoxychorismate/anthranilate synthase component II n=1 Tax=Nibrella saemangeumensis TaxID=1084526 RepID=A0ABP8N199_9BACT